VASRGRRYGVTIAVDAMGGDHAPDEVIKGASDAAAEGAGVVLVGPEDVVRERMQILNVDLPVHHAPSVIGMDDAVSTSMYRQRSSLRVAVDLVAREEAGAAVSAGNSAAIMAIAIHVLGRQPGIDRPAFGGPMPSGHGRTFVLDIGANAAVKPNNLVQFAIMGEAYVQVCHGIEVPRIALLSNGSEPTKGTKVIKEAYEHLAKLDLNFVGNVEGNMVFDGAADVVVCDGFSGNVLLKTAEGVAGEIFHLMKNEIEKDFVARVASAALIPVFQRIRRRVDYQEVGGVPVLGVDGVVINCHGRSQALAIKNAILQAEKMAGEHLVERIGENLHHESAESGRRRRLARALHLRATTP